MILERRQSPPHSLKLAINPAPNELPHRLEWFHVFLNVLDDHQRYWYDREQAARTLIDVAGHNLARDIGAKFTSVATDIKTHIDTVKETGRDYNTGVNLPAVRRIALGTLAVSRFMEFLIQEELLPGRHTGDTKSRMVDAIGAAASPTLLLDMDAKDGVPLDYRIHLSRTMATDPNHFPNPKPPAMPSLDAWFFGERSNNDTEISAVGLHTPLPQNYDPSNGGLWIHRTPADFSPGLTRYLERHNLSPDPSDMATFFPFIPAPNGPPILL